MGSPGSRRIGPDVTVTTATPKTSRDHAQSRSQHCDFVHDHVKSGTGMIAGMSPVPGPPSEPQPEAKLAAKPEREAEQSVRVR